MPFIKKFCWYYDDKYFKWFSEKLISGIIPRKVKDSKYFFVQICALNRPLHNKKYIKQFENKFIYLFCNYRKIKYLAINIYFIVM